MERELRKEGGERGTGGEREKAREGEIRVRNREKEGRER